MDDVSEPLAQKLPIPAQSQSNSERVPLGAALFVLICGSALAYFMFTRIEAPLAQTHINQEKIQKDMADAQKRQAALAALTAVPSKTDTSATTPVTQDPATKDPRSKIDMPGTEATATTTNPATGAGLTPSPESGGGSAAAAPGDGKKPKKGKTPPFNPLAGDIRPTAIPGNLAPPNLPLATGNPGQSNPALLSNNGSLTTATLESGDSASAMQRAASAARSLGGSASKFEEFQAGNDDSAPVLIICVPQAKLQSFLKRVGANVVDEWEGDADDRRSLLSRGYKSKLNELRKRREDLLIKYTDDAPNVKELNVDIDHMQKNIDAVRSVSLSSKMAVVKISGSSS